MFEGLDDINWGQFGDTHIAIGMKTQEIPGCIRNMLHEDPDEREYAIASLLGEGQHLGMLDKATPYIIPYVLEVLADKDYEQRGYLILGLALMFDHMFRSESFDHLRLATQIYDEIKKGYPLYKRLLSDTEKEVRLFTAQVIGYMQDNSVDAIASLLAQLAVEIAGEVRREIITAMLKLVKDSLSPYTDEGRQSVVSLYDYLKDNGSFEEQVQLARALKQIHFIHDKDINSFVQQILARADSTEK